MTFFQSVRSALTKCATFSGRACRSEFWWFVLFYSLVGAVATLLDDIVQGTRYFECETRAIELLARTALLLPSTAVAIRRLHDVGWSGWWLLTIVPPVLISLMKGDDGLNDWGPPP